MYKNFVYEQVSSNSLSLTQKLGFYANFAADYINMEAVFSDETNSYVKHIPNKNGVSFKIRVAKNNVDKVFCCFNDQQLEMSLDLSNDNLCDDFFDYYVTTIENLNETISYYFMMEKNSGKYFYNKRGLYGEIDANFNFSLIANFNTPDWAKGAVIYQIYVDRFFDGDKTNNIVQNEFVYLGQAAKPIENWEQLPANLDVANFYGGDLLGVMKKIPYLVELGVEVIYFCPIFVSPSNHKYDIQDYDYVDPHLGTIVADGGEPLYFEKFHNKFATKYIKRTTDLANLEASNDLLIKLIELAHENGIKVILDGVFNHCGAYNKWLDKENFYSAKNHADGAYPNGAYLDKNSPYHDYFRWYDSNWPNNDCYDSWWGFDNHPKLNYENSEELYNYIINIGKKWVTAPFNADGWRFDVAADLGFSKEFNHKFWTDFRREVKAVNPDAIILAEHYGDPKDWLDGTQWDTIMNYDAFMEPLTWFLTGMEKHSEEFRADMLSNAIAFESAMRFQMSRLNIQSLQVAMNQLSNHDHSRFLTRTNMKVGRLATEGAARAGVGVNKAIMMEAVTFQMTWPGAPTLYYGDEVSVVGWTDPDNRRTYPWGKEDNTMLAFHKEIISIHKRYKTLKTGCVEFLYTNFGILSFGRFDNNNQLVTIINNNIYEKQLTIPVWKAEICGNCELDQLIFTSGDNFTTEQKTYVVEKGFLKITLPPFSSVVLVKRKN